MKLIYLPAALFLFLVSAAALYAQEPEDEDPQDLFPSVVLEIEDLSIEKIDAALPKEAELMTFERETPLPGPEEIRLVEPAVDALLPGLETKTGEGRSFFASALFGAGLQNNLLTEITFLRLGLQPVIRLLFSYEKLDGFDYRQVGLGYGARSDRFAGSIKYKNNLISLEAEGGFREREQGLQEQTAYFSSGNQFAHADVAFSARASDVFTVFMKGRGRVTSFSVTGAAHPTYPVTYPPTEYLAGGALRGEFAWPQITVGLGVDYVYRNIPGDDAFLTHRFTGAADVKFEASDRFSGEGAFGVFTSTQIQYLLPFHVTLRALPFDWLSLSAGGGYRVLEQNLANTLPEFTYPDFPAAFADNHGWYASAGAQISFESAFLLIVEAALSENANYPTQSRTPDPVTGLYPIIFGSEVTDLSFDCRLKLPLFPWLSVNALSRLDFPLNAGYFSRVSLGGEALVEEVNGAFGVKATLTFKTGFTSNWEFPYLDASAYVRVLDNMKFVIEGLDLLSPLLSGPRYAPEPYIAPGIRARFKIEIAL
jgi:hypothetical protein